VTTILAVDDEEDMLEVIAYNLEREGHDVLRAQSAHEALTILDRETPDLIISDIMMPGMDGLAFCAEVRTRRETALTPFLFVTAKTQSDDKYAGLRVGADDYITKPFDLPDLLARVRGRLEHRERIRGLEQRLLASEERWTNSFEPDEIKTIRAEQRRIVDEVQDAGHVQYQPPDPDSNTLRAKIARFEERFDGLTELRNTDLVGDSAAHLRVFEEIVIAASSPDPTSIFGDTGTGKTATAEAIWKLGKRKDAPFRTVNCSELAAGDPTIASGKLFGYGKNSGLPNLPRDGQPGLLEEADGGVLFLDEVATLPPQAQALLLLPLEGRPFRPAVGTGPERRVNVKFVLATNRDLAEEADLGRFPRDLYERIAGEVIRLPNLRERKADIPLLCDRFLDQLLDEEGTRRELSAGANKLLSEYDWPGNVRELQRSVRHAFRRADLEGRDTIEADDLPEALRTKATSPPIAASNSDLRCAPPGSASAPPRRTSATRASPEPCRTGCAASASRHSAARNGTLKPPRACSPVTTASSPAWCSDACAPSSTAWQHA